MKKYIVFSIVICAILCAPMIVASDVSFEARIISISQEYIKDEFGLVTKGMVTVEGLSNGFEGKEIIFDSFADIEVVGSPQFKEGDKVVVSVTDTPDGEPLYHVVDYVRTSALYWLVGLFSLAVILVGRLKGLKALVVLFLTFVVIIKFIIPQIMGGANPMLISSIGSIVILGMAIFGTEGLKKKSFVAFEAIVISLGIVLFLSWAFTVLARLTGLANEEVIFLSGLNNISINFQGLLLAGMIIGALGVLDDVVISQVSTIMELFAANPMLSSKEVYKKAMRVGVDHINAMVNTLFLAYAGASLPLLVLLTVHEPPFVIWSSVINNELIATEVVRTFAGSISLVFAVPIATLLAAYQLKKK